MKTLSIPGFVSLSKLVIRLLLNSFILGPLAIVYGLIAEAFLATGHSILFDKTGSALLIILAGGFFGSFVCMAASILILLPIAIWELNQATSVSKGVAVFKKYLPIPALLSVLMALILCMAGEFKPLPAEPLAFIISFYLTASTGLYLMSRQLSTSSISSINP